MKTLEILLRRFVPTFLTLSTFLPFSAPAAPPPHRPSPKQTLCTSIENCFEQGAKFYETGNYREALPFLQESYQRTKERKLRAQLLKYIARAHAILREPVEAKIYLSLYLAENPRDSERADLENIIDALGVYAQGIDLYKKGDYLAAIDVFKKVYEQVVKTKNLRVALLYDLAQSYEQLGRGDLAVEYYNLYLTDAGDKAQDRENVRAKIAALQKKGVVVPPSKAELKPVEVTAASAPALTLASAREPQQTYFQKHPWSTATGSLAAAALVGGTAFGYLARSKFNDLTDSCSNTGCQENDIQTVASRSKIANGLFIGGGIMGAAAISLYIWESYREPAAQKVPKKWNGTSPRAFGFTPTGLEVQF